MAVCCLVACTKSTVATDNNEQIATAYRLQAFAIDPFEEPLGDYSDKQNARALIVARFGEPLASAVSERQDRTSDEMFSEYVYDYDGLRFQIVENEVGDRSGIQITEITGNTHPLKYDLHIGATRDDVIAALGQETRRFRESKMELTTNTVQDPPGQEEWHGGTIGVHIEFESERVSKIMIMPSGL